MPHAAKARSFPSAPNKRTIANLVATAEYFRTAHTIAEFSEAHKLDYPAAAERVRMMLASGCFQVSEGKGTRRGARGAFPVSYVITGDLKPIPAPVEPKHETPVATPAEVPATPVAE